MDRRRRRRVVVALGVLVVLAGGVAVAGVGAVGAHSISTDTAPDCSTISYTTNGSGWYEVTNVSRLQCITDQGLGQDYVLTSDIDASGTSTWNGGDGFVPIGDLVGPFTGTFDGAGYTISGLTIDRGSNVGLFGVVSDGTVEDVGVNNVEINGSEYVGGLVGRNNADVTESYATGDVNGTKFVGGLVGENLDDVTESYATGNVNGTRNVGGLVGENEGVVTESYATGDVKGDEDYGGGLAGRNYGNVTKSYATGDVDGDIVGGLIGLNNGGSDSNGYVNNSYATGDISGTQDAGGLVGFESGGTVEDAYWDVDTTGQSSSAGSPDANGLSTSEMQGQAATQNLDGFAFTGTWHATSGYPALAWEDTDPFYGVAVNSTTSPVFAGETLDVTATVTNWGADGGSQTVTLTDTDFSNSQQDSESNVALDSGDSTDLTLSWATGTESGSGDVTVGSDDASATASVTVDPYAGGDGSSGTPYEISNWYHLDNVRNNLDKEFVLTADLDSNTAGYSSVASSSANSNNGFLPLARDTDTGSAGYQGTKFTGTFDGNGHTISGLTIDRGSTDYVGLFGVVDGDVVQNVGVENVDITGNRNVGGLVGRSDSTVKTSYVTGSVTGNGNYVGGIVGQNDDGTVKRSYATGDVTGSSDVGGLVGSNLDTVKRSYATGDVTGSSDVGGLVGSNLRTVKTSYATGDVTGSSLTGGLVGFSLRTVTDGYWGVDTTGQSSSAGSPDANGLSTAEMQRFAPQVTMDGFSFESPETWLVTGGYPALAWESVTELTVDSVEAADTTVDEDASGSVTVTANEGGTDAGEGVTIEVVDDDGLDGFATGDTAVTDSNGQVTFGFTEPDGGTYTPVFAWQDDTDVSGSATVTVRDLTDPTVSIGSPSDGAALDAHPTLAGTAGDGAGTGVSTVEVQIENADGDTYDGSDFTAATTWVRASGTTSWSYDTAASGISTDGTYVVSARATDGDGNTALTPTRTYTVDTTAPSISSFDVFTPSPSEQDVTVTFDSDEQLPTISASVTGAETATLTGSDFTETDNGDGTYTYRETYSASSDGDYTLTLDTAQDSTGNDGARGQSETVTVDTSPPVFEPTIVTTNAPVVEGETLTIRIRITNTGGTTGTDTVALSYGGFSKDLPVALNGGESTTVRVSRRTRIGEAGNYTAELTTADATATTAVRITQQPPENLSIDLDRSSLSVGETTNVTLTAVYSDGTSTAVTDSADLAVTNTTVVTLDNETLAAQEPGETTVTASYKRLQATATLAVSARAEPPALQDAVVEDSRPRTIVLTFDRAVELIAGTPTTGFAVSLDDNPVTLDTASAAGETVSLRLPAPVWPGDTLAVSYTGSDNLQSKDGVPADSFDQPVRNTLSGETVIEGYEVSRTAVLVDRDPVWINVTVTNRQTDEATMTVPLRVDGETVAQREVRLGSGVTTTLSFERVFTEAGVVNVTVGEQVTTRIEVVTMDISDDGNAARDLDGDGRHEDIDGDGAFTLRDVQLFLDARQTTLVSEYPELFDFDGDGGRVTLSDVQALFLEHRDRGDS